MAIRAFLQSLGATHLFDLSDNTPGTTAIDLGDSVDPTQINGGTYTTTANPVCEGVDNSLTVAASTNNSTDGAVFDNRNDINGGNGSGNDSSTFNYVTGTRSLIVWFKQDAIQNPTCIYEQGGGTNNFAFMGGALTTFQAADAGQPFLIAQGKSLAQPRRPYFLTGIWEYHSQHAGAGNRILFYINGILQQIVEDTSTAQFPGHIGDIAAGNSSDSLKSFAETTYSSQTTAKNLNFLGMYNNVSLTQAQAREIFERTVFADVTIAADTVANQQAALDALIGSTYQDTNCAIRIIQATDATNYRLFIDSLTFNSDSNLEDISIQFVGTGNLTLEETNGTILPYTSTPLEVEQTGGILVGGGTINIVPDTIRFKSNDTITNSNASKLVFDGTGTVYNVSGGSIAEFENVSGNTVTVNLLNGAPLPTITETNGAINVVQVVSITATNLIDDTRVQLYNVTKDVELDNSVITGGSGYNFNINLGDSNIDDGDVLRLRACYQLGTVAKKEIESTGVVTITGLSFIDSQVDNEVYSSYGVDGSTITEFIWDNTNIEVDINDSNNSTEIQRLGAWYFHEITSPEGIRSLFRCINWESINSISIDQSMCDLKIENTKTEPLLLVGGRLYRLDGTTVISPTSNSVQIDYSPVYSSNVNDIWNVDLVAGEYDNASAANIIKNLPRIVTKKQDL
jgi:hypothetical protein